MRIEQHGTLPPLSHQLFHPRPQGADLRNRGQGAKFIDHGSSPFSNLHGLDQLQGTQRHGLLTHEIFEGSQ